MKDIDNKEKISMLMDNHWERFEQDAIIKDLKSDSALLETWTRYHLIGDTLRGTPNYCKSGICSGVMDRLKQEPSILVPRWRKPVVQKWIKEVGIGSAVAAAILLAIILIPVQQQELGDTKSPALAGSVLDAPRGSIPAESETAISRTVRSNNNLQFPANQENLHSPVQSQTSLAHSGGGAGIPELEKLMRAHSTTYSNGYLGMRSARTASLVINKTSMNP